MVEEKEVLKKFLNEMPQDIKEALKIENVKNNKKVIPLYNQAYSHFEEALRSSNAAKIAEAKGEPKTAKGLYDYAKAQLGAMKIIFKLLRYRISEILRGMGYRVRLSNTQLLWFK